MAEHRREQVIKKVKQLLEAALPPTVAAANVTRNRKYPIADSGTYPQVNILQGPDAPLAEFGYTNVSFMDRQVVLFFDIIVKNSAADDADEKLNLVEQAVHKALAADYKQGLAFVITSIPGNTGEPDTDAQGNAALITMRTEWAFQYRSSVADPGA